MKKYLMVTGICLLFACSENKEKGYVKEDSLSIANQVLNNQLKIKEAIVDTLLTSYNEIQDNLNEIKEKEKIVSINFKDFELKKSKKEQIVSDVQFIYKLLNRNRQVLVSMNEKLKGSDLKITKLEKFIDNLTKQITEQEIEIISLKDTLSNRNAELSSLNLNLEKERKESVLKTGRLNTAYCAIGTQRELEKEGLVITKGGIVGLGKLPVLNQGLTKGIFSVIDIYGTTEISIAAKKVRVITVHPQGSYRLEDTKTSIKKLVIVDPDEFWKTSRYLIIAVSAEDPTYGS